MYNEARSFTKHTFAASTQASYQTHLRAYLRFCIFYSVNPVPISQFELLAYIAFLARSLKPTSITNYLNIIRLLHLDAGYENPLLNNFAVQNLKKGIARQLGSPPEQKLPITSQILLNIKHRLDFMAAGDVCFWAALVVGFFGFLRKSTLLPISNPKPGDACIRRCDLDMPDNHTVVLYIKKTKTIQCNERVLIMPYVASPGNPLCPVRAIIDLLTVAPIDPQLPLFSYEDSEGVKSWTHSSFVKKLKDLLKDMGLDPTKYSGHSLRRGGATLGFQLGLSLPQVKNRGDWKSSAVENYIFVTRGQINKVATILIKGSLNPVP